MTNEYRYRLESNFVAVNRLFVQVYSNVDVNVERYKPKKNYLLEGIIRNYNVIINGKKVFNQPIGSGIKRHEEIGQLTTGQSEDCTTGLLDYDCIKNHYRLIVVDLSRQRELEAD